MRQLTARVAASKRCAAGPSSSAWNNEVGPTTVITAATWPMALNTGADSASTPGINKPCTKCRPRLRICSQVMA